nr:uncharacterized protein LOC114825446 [Malus domestica]
MTDSTQNTKSDEEFSDPYTMHHSDHTGLILVSKHFTETTTGNGAVPCAWVSAQRIRLGSLMEPSKLHHSWTQSTQLGRCNDMVTLWIVNSVHSDIASIIIYTETAVTVWNDLKDRFSQSSDLRIYQIRQEIVENCQEQLSVFVYYTKMKALWDELASYHDPLVQVQQASVSQLTNNKHFNTSSRKSLKCTYYDEDGHLVDRCSKGLRSKEVHLEAFVEHYWAKDG